MADGQLNNNPVLRRDIDLMPVQADKGNTLIVVRDPLELDRRGPLAISSGALPLLALLDGRNSVEDIRRSLVEQMARAGQLTAIPLEVVESVIRGLDEAYLLDNSRYQEARQKLVDSFTSLRERPAALAGKSYPEDPQQCREFLADILADTSAQARVAGLTEAEIVALVAPHIELRAGRKVYAAAYGALAGRSYDRVIILGVGHNLELGLFSITDKDYATPLGRVPTDRIAAKKLRKAAGELASPEDFAHRSEHSVEFQVLFLQHVLEGAFSVVPVLCGSLFEFLAAGTGGRPRKLELLVPVLDCLAELIADPNRRTLVVAGVDFCHIGPKFGDARPAVQISRHATAHDLALLKHLVAVDVEAFCAEGRLVQDRYHVCGFTVLSLLLEVLPEVRGVELGRQIWHETATRSAVSFAAAAFVRE